MKKIVFGLLMTMGMLNAQNNLVFNQVLILDFTNNAAEPYIVPEGKVWKVESATLGSTFKVDGNTWTMGDLGSYRMGPIWIPENSALSGGSSDADFISVLEFDVVPTSTGTGSGTGGGGVSSDGLIFEEAMSITLTTTQNLNSDASLFGEITVPEGKILKIFNVSTFLLFPAGYTQNEGYGFVYIGDELFNPSLSNNNTITRFIPSGTHTVKLDWVSTNRPNRIVVNALLYSIP